MYCVEFFADKTPGVDTGWDAIHSFIRIPAGIILAAGAVGEVNPALAIAAGIIGGSVAATSHKIKAGTRVLINTTPEPFSNWGASFTEDVAVIVGLWLALHSPMLFLALFVQFIMLAIWLIPQLRKAIVTVFRKIFRLFGKQSVTDPSGQPGALSVGGPGLAQQRGQSPAVMLPPPEPPVP
jgi:hypothetical protein